MFTRLTFCKFNPEHIQEAKKVFHEQIIPVIRKQKGNTNVTFLEPTDKSDDFISITQWKSKSDADAYDAEGTYKKLVSKLQDYFAKPPVLKTYVAEDARVSVADPL